MNQSAVPLDAEENVTPRILLLDDDVLFCRLMTKLGAKRNIPVIACQNVQTFRELARWAPHDVVILDYYLEGEETGTDIARELPRESVIMISGNEAPLAATRTWPKSIKASLPKSKGIQAILEAARTLQN